MSPGLGAPWGGGGGGGAGAAGLRARGPFPGHGEPVWEPRPRVGREAMYGLQPALGPRGEQPVGSWGGEHPAPSAFILLLHRPPAWQGRSLSLLRTPLPRCRGDTGLCRPPWAVSPARSTALEQQEQSLLHEITEGEPGETPPAPALAFQGGDIP